MSSEHYFRAFECKILFAYNVLSVEFNTDIPDGRGSVED
jgi:hypothetical protein